MTPRSTRTSLTALLVLGAVAISSACGGLSSGDESLGRAELEPANLSQFELRALDDKTVTAAELEEAGQVLGECLQANGFRVLIAEGQIGPDAMISEFTAPPDSPDGKLPPDEQLAMEQLEQGCRDEVSAVAAVWVLQNQASKEEQQAAQEALPGCLAEAGLAVPPGADFTEAATVGLEYEPIEGDGVDTAAVGRCLNTALAATTQALPGLADALAAFDLGASQ